MGCAAPSCAGGQVPRAHGRPASGRGHWLQVNQDYGVQLTRCLSILLIKAGHWHHFVPISVTISKYLSTEPQQGRSPPMLFLVEFKIRTAILNMIETGRALVDLPLTVAKK